MSVEPTDRLQVPLNCARVSVTIFGCNSFAGMVAAVPMELCSAVYVVQGEEIGLVPHCTAEILDILLEALYVACLVLQWLLVAVDA